MLVNDIFLLVSSLVKWLKVPGNVHSPLWSNVSWSQFEEKQFSPAKCGNKQVKDVTQSSARWDILMKTFYSKFCFHLMFWRCAFVWSNLKEYENT